jgi:FlaA1/EpsC-like NDP-sugar epimerase
MQPNSNRVVSRGQRYPSLRVIKSSLLDAVILLIAYTAAFYARAVTTTLDYVNSLGIVLVIAVFTILTLHTFGVYRRIWERTSGHEVTVIINAVGAATFVIVLIYLLVTEERPLPLSVMLMGNLLALCGFVAVRYRSRLISGVTWRWKAIWHHDFPSDYIHVLIIGAGESGQSLAWRLKYRSPNGKKYRIIGFIDDDPEKHHMLVEGCEVLGDRAMIEAIAERRKVDLIVVSMHNISGRDFRDILAHCEKTKALIKVIPDLFALVNARQQATLLRNVQAEDLIGRKMVTRHEAISLDELRHKSVLITGAAGSIGSELSTQIMQYDPAKVILLDNNESGLHDLVTELKTRFPHIDLVPALVDITVESMVYRVFDDHQPQIVFHTAAYKHVPMLEYYPSEAVRVNVGGTRNLAQLARNFTVERFVLISTDKAVNPSSVMGASKRICELFLHALSQADDCNTRFTSVRFGNVLGSRGSVVPTFEQQIENGGPVTVTHPDMTRYFMSIAEAVNLIIHAACLTAGDDIFILKMGEVVRIVELAERMIRLRGLRPYEDVEIQFTGIRPGEKLHEQLLNDTENAQPTPHPNIIQLSSWDDKLDMDAFCLEVDQLLADPGAFESTALSKFFAAIQADRDYVFVRKSEIDEQLKR